MRGTNTLATTTATPLYWPRLADGVLRIDATASNVRRRSREAISADTETLRIFTNLAGASDEAVGAFASRHGFLGLCGHGLPATHPADRVPGPHDFFFAPSNVTLGRPTPRCQPLYAETPEAWRTYAKTFRGLLHLGRALRHDRAERQLWDDLSAAFSGEFPPKLLGEQRTYLSLIISDAVRLADLRPVLRWQKNVLAQPTFILEGASRTLFSPLVAQLIRAIAQVELVRCSNPVCGELYWPLKKGRVDRGNYCPQCQTAGVSKKLADARHERNRKRSRVKT